MDRSLPVPRGTIAVGGFPDCEYTNDDEYDAKKYSLKIRMIMNMLLGL